MDDQWEAGAEQGLDTDAALGVVQRLFEDVSANVVGYLVAALALALALGAAWTALLVGAGALVIPGVVMDDDSILQIGAGLAALVGVFGALLLAVLSTLAHASLIRAIDASLRGGAPITWSSAFSTIPQDALRLTGFALLMGALSLVASLFCFLPAIPVWGLGAFALPIVVLDGVGIREGLSRAGSHMVANLGFHAVVWLILFVAYVALTSTGLGSLVVAPFLAGYQVFAYHVAFSGS